jgi:hypothetical protein
VGILSIVLAIKYEKDKIQKLKNEARKAKFDSNVGLSGVKLGEVKGSENVLKAEDVNLQNWIRSDDKAIEEAKKPKDRTTEDTVSGFNRIYGRNNESGR